MSKLKDLVNKGVRLIVTETDEGGAGSSPGPPPEIPPESLDVAPPTKVTQSAVPAQVADFTAVYREAGVEIPPHGFGIEKVAEMLQNKRLASLPREAKAAAVLAMLETAGVSPQDVIQDAVLRDKSLDAFEAAKEREAQDLKKKNEAQIQKMKAELEDVIRRINEEVERLRRESEAASETFAQLQARKRREEERLFELVSYFAEGTGNPISTSGPSGSPPPPPRDAGKA